MTMRTYLKMQAKKPAGGFRFLTVQQLCLIWWAYRIRLIQLRDLRVWFAAQEMVARRCQLAPSQIPVFTPQKLHGLIGGRGGEHLRASLRRLAAAGLLTWATTQLTFATSPTDLRGLHDLSAFHTMVGAIPNPARRVPVPRQALRLIAGGCRPSVIATILGHLIRCLYYREHRCISGGWCKASWIADVFRLDLRNIKAARKYLVVMGWLQLRPIPQSLCNRWGSYTLINLSWTRATMATAAQDDAQTPPSSSPLPPALCTPTSPPPSKEHREPLQDPHHQKPTPPADLILPPLSLHHTAPTTGGAASGVKKQLKDKKPPLRAPTLEHIMPEDLQETARLLALFAQAQTHGLIGKSDSERLTFLGLAEHAKVVGSANPCGLFATLVRRQCWHFVTDSDEDAAHQRFKAYLYGTDHQTRDSPQPHGLVQPELSKDAAIVRYLQTQFARAGFDGDLFGLVRQDDASWTRERWDHAVRELEQARCAWQQTRALNRLGDLTAFGEPLGSLVSTNSVGTRASAS
jgi:hypothetical protein